MTQLPWKLPLKLFPLESSNHPEWQIFDPAKQQKIAQSRNVKLPQNFLSYTV